MNRLKIADLIRKNYFMRSKFQEIADLAGTDLKQVEQIASELRARRKDEREKEVRRLAIKDITKGV